MQDLLVHLPEDILGRLQREAESKGTSVEEVLVAILRRAIGVSRDEVEGEDARLELFIREGGLFAPPEQKLGPELEKQAREASPQERERLAGVLSRGKSLSEISLEDRGKRG